VLVARVKEGFQDDLDGLEDLPGGSSVRTLSDQQLVALLGAPGVRPSGTALVSDGSAADTAEDLVTGVGGGLGLAAAVGEATAAGVSGPLLGGAFVAGYATAMPTDSVTGVLTQRVAQHRARRSSGSKGPHAL
jgi:hypothetical protein